MWKIYSLNSFENENKRSLEDDVIYKRYFFSDDD